MMHGRLFSFPRVVVVVGLSVVASAAMAQRQPPGAASRKPSAPTPLRPASIFDEAAAICGKVRLALAALPSNPLYKKLLPYGKDRVDSSAAYTRTTVMRCQKEIAAKNPSALATAKSAASTLDYTLLLLKSPPPEPKPTKKALAPEVAAILQGKQFIERVNANLDNPYFDLAPVNAHIRNPKRLMVPIPDEDAKAATLYGYHHVILKPAHKSLAATVRPYVTFSRPIDFAALKAKGYKDVWVDRKNPKCDPTILYGDDAPNPSDPAYPPTNKTVKDLQAKLMNPATPACSLRGAVTAFCPPNPHRHNLDPKKPRNIIIRVRGGEYSDAADVKTTSLCGDMIITNHDNETVRLTNLINIKDGPPDGKAKLPWKRIDETKNIWAVAWPKNVNGANILLLDGERVRAVKHHDISTVSPEQSHIEGPFKDRTLLDEPAPVFHWVDVVEDKSKAKERADYIATENKAGRWPDTGEWCKNSSPTPPPVTNRYDNFSDLWMLGKINNNCMNKDVCNLINPETIKFTDPRTNCCHWSMPLPKAEECEINYRTITRFQIDKKDFHPKYCAKLPGAPERCLVVKLPVGREPKSYESIRSALDNWANPFDAYQTYNPKTGQAFYLKNVVIRGLQIHAFSDAAHSYLTIAGSYTGFLTNPSDFYFRFDGLEVAYASPFLFGTDVHGVSKTTLENSYFRDLGFVGYVMNAKGDVVIRNNYFLRVGDKTFHLQDGLLKQSDFLKAPKETPKNRMTMNTFHFSGGNDVAGMHGWSIENNHWYRSGGQEMMEVSWQALNTRIVQNWFEENNQFSVIFNGGAGLPVQIRHVEIKSNQSFNSPGGKGKPGAEVSSAITGFSVANEASSLVGAGAATCEDVTISNNLFARLHKTVSAMSLHTNCKDVSIDHNTFHADEWKTTATTGEKEFAKFTGVVVGGYVTDMKNFAVTDNYAAGTGFGVQFYPLDCSMEKKTGNFTVGEFLEKCQKHHKWAKESFCPTMVTLGADYPANGATEPVVEALIKKCEAAFEAREKATCTKDLEDKVAAAFLKPKEFKYANNHSDECKSRGRDEPETKALDAKYCTKAPAKFALSDSYDYRVVGAKKPIGAQYLVSPPTYLKGMEPYRLATPDDLFDLVKKSRGQ